MSRKPDLYILASYLSVFSVRVSRIIYVLRLSELGGVESMPG